MVGWRDRRDQSAAVRLVRELSPQMHRVALRALPFAWMAEDAVQTAWMKLFRSLESFDPRIPLAAWAVMIVKRVCWNMRRGHQPREAIAFVEIEQGSLELIDPVLSPSDQSMMREQLAAVFSMSERLPCRDRQIFQHLLTSEGGAPEIARQIGMSTGAVRVRACRIRSALRASLSSRLRE